MSLGASLGGAGLLIWVELSSASILVWCESGLCSRRLSHWLSAELSRIREGIILLGLVALGLWSWSPTGWPWCYFQEIQLLFPRASLCGASRARVHGVLPILFMASGRGGPLDCPIASACRIGHTVEPCLGCEKKKKNKFVLAHDFVMCIYHCAPVCYYFWFIVSCVLWLVVCQSCLVCRVSCVACRA